MNKKILIAGAIFGVLAVALGAFGAHGLKGLISLEAQQTFETGVRYQMYHAILLLIVGQTSYLSNRSKNSTYYFLVFGMVFFSGSIYALATNDLTSFDFKTIALLTPLGGLLLIASWLIMLFNFFKIKQDK
ncbi:DUF423 domain-containing protein [Yeosuana sp. MJ-SS3]|uniref:DUF423 domain-containing protein n=1 Tax=Gilvirhabdus luticola TaxID=3079858 RepID=A0ABU3U3G7_9FLAO|nr:DUF423 domain-containing protein [Yeosuana sp. MJ-SS3]MDU8884949.1 DUF423 domain-containing protein [Yeosuana sp. MJ-SS3]